MKIYRKTPPNIFFRKCKTTTTKLVLLLKCLKKHQNKHMYMPLGQDIVRETTGETLSFYVHNNQRLYYLIRKGLSIAYS